MFDFILLAENTVRVPKSIDWMIIVAGLAISFLPSIYFARRAGKSTAEFFASGRSVPWWLAGISMVATTFSTDVPNLVTNIVRTQGVAGNWQWWAFTITGVITVFFYARLWRRSEVLTDLEFYDVRYGGRAASFVRGFRAIYLGFFFNCVIMASVNLAACKIAGVLFGMDRWETLLFVGLLNVFFAIQTGLWGVLVIDMIQFFIMMTASIAMAYFAVQHVGGLDVMLAKVSEMPGPVGATGLRYADILPDFTSCREIAIAVFVMPLAVQWWAVWYPGSEPGGGSYVAQRMLASKSERDSLGSVLFFNVAHYVLRPWPWILTALASLVVFPSLVDIQTAFPHVPPSLVAHDIAYPAMMKFLPIGFFGLMICSLIAAHSSTLLTHLNWGASYCVHDFYRRFIAKDRSERHYVQAGRISTLLLLLGSCAMVYLLESSKAGFDLMLQIGAGTGLLYMIRWFWWRINAWCEVVAMVVSFAVSTVFLIGDRVGWWCTNAAAWIDAGVSRIAKEAVTQGAEFSAEAAGSAAATLAGAVPMVLGTHERLLTTVMITTVAWFVTAFVVPVSASQRETLRNFYRKVKPGGPGWEPIRRETGLTIEEVRATGDQLPTALLGTVAGCAMIWSSLFAVGNFLYGRNGYAAVCTAVFVVSGAIVLRIVRVMWRQSGSA